MILLRCSYCKRLFAIESDSKDKVFKVNCPNDNCNKTYVVRGNSVIDMTGMSIIELCQAVEKIIMPNIMNMDEKELNMLIKELSNNYAIGNILICELINSLLKDDEKFATESEYFIPRLDEKPYSLKDLFDKLDKRICQEERKLVGGNVSLKLANQCIQTLQEEKEILMEQIEQMKNIIHKLKHQLEIYE